MGPKSKRQKSNESFLSSGRTILADKRKAEIIENAKILSFQNELQSLQEELEYFKAKYSHAQEVLTKMNTNTVSQQKPNKICKSGQECQTKPKPSKSENYGPVVNGVDGIGGLNNNNSHRTPVRIDYHEACKRDQYNRQVALKKLILESGLAKSDVGYHSFIRGALPKTDQKCLRAEFYYGESSSSDSSDNEEQAWLLTSIPPQETQRQRCKQYITYSNQDKVFVLDLLINCLSWEEISIGIKQIIGLYPKYHGLTTSKVVCWRKASAGELKKPGVKVNAEFESDVWSRLLLCVLKENIDLTGEETKNTIRAEVVVNVTYSYDIVKTAAIEVQESIQWKDSKDDQGLKFSNR